MTTEILRPNANGSEIAISSQEPDVDLHYDKVDEVSADDADYVYDTGTTGVYKRDLFALPNGAGAGTINSVTVYARLLREPFGFDTQQISLRTEATTYDYDMALLPNDDTFEERNTGALAVNPQTGLAWTWTQINALEIGANIRGWSAAGDPKCSQVWVVIDYTPVVGRSFGYIIG